MENVKPETDTAKRAAGEAAATLVESGMRLGLGTGTTTAFAIEAIGRRVREEGLQVVGVPTSFAAERLARQHGVPLVTLDDLGLGDLAPGQSALDLALDGADEVDPALNLIKGRGAAHTREKVVASLATRFVVLIDPSKEVDQLGTTMPVPVEVLPMAEAAVARVLRELGGEPVLRMGQKKDGPVVTDQCFWILDTRFGGILEPEALASRINQIPGVLDHGLFIGLATDVLVGEPDGSVRRMKVEG
ncbi:MAG: ribose-5-phosphate isomerase RpiA [Rhodothermaceae bacterium]|nr:ribose-5-phosphate isomerase RpiA [Rhodothermaceae bacterium]